MVGLAREVAALLGGELHPPEPPDPEIVDVEEVDDRRRGLRRLPALHRPRLPRRRDRPVAAVAALAPLPRRDALDLERRRRHELRRCTSGAARCTPSTARSSRAGASSSGARGPGEELRTLDGTLRRLDPDDLLITDGEKAVALAAIMGGEDSEVTDETTERAARGGELRAARDPPDVRAARAAHGRLEPLGEGRRPVPRRERRGAREPAARRPRRRADDRPRRRPRRAAGAAGRPLPPGARVEAHRARHPARRAAERRSTGFGFDVVRRLGGDRADVARARRHARGRPDRGGRAAACSTGSRTRCPCAATCRAGSRKEQRLRRVVEDTLVGAGLSEAYTWSLVASDPSPDAIRLPNPMSSEQAILRTTIVPGLVEAARIGVDAGAEHVALFEIARVYLALGRAAARRALARRRDRRPAATRTIKGVARDALRRARARAAGRAGLARPAPSRARRPTTEAGWLGELHPSLLEGTWGAFELDLETLFAERPGADRLRGRHHVSGGAAGHRGRRRRGRRGRRARRRGARGRRAGSCARRASSTSTAAIRSAPGASPSRSTSRSSRPSGRSRRKRRPRRASASWPRSRSDSRPSCAPEQSDSPSAAA